MSRARLWEFLVNEPSNSRKQTPAKLHGMPAPPWHWLRPIGDRVPEVTSALAPNTSLTSGLMVLQGWHGGGAPGNRKAPPLLWPLGRDGAVTTHGQWSTTC